MGISAFRGISKSTTDGLGMGSFASLGAHNSLLQIGGSAWGSSAAWGAGLGAGYGALDGAFSYDGSIMGGAFHGAIMGAGAGLATRAAAGAYSKGAADSAFGTASFNKNTGAFKNEWSSGYTRNGDTASAFQWGAFSRGWNS